MKQAYKRAVKLMAVFVIACGVNGQLRAETWKITSLEWPPYAGANLEGQGTSVARLRDLLAAEGIELEVEFYPWKRAQHLARREGYVGFFPAWPEGVPAGFIASDDIDVSVLGVVHRRGETIEWKGFNALFSRYRVGLISTYVYPKAVVKAAGYNPLHTFKVPQEETLVRMLVGERIDVALTDPRVTLFLAKRENIDSLVSHAQAQLSLPLVLSIRADKNATARRQLLSRALAKSLSSTAHQ